MRSNRPIPNLGNSCSVVVHHLAWFIFLAVSMCIYFLPKHSPSVSDYFTQNNSPNHHRANVNLQQLLLVVERVILKKKQRWPFTENATCLVSLLHYCVLRSLLQRISLELLRSSLSWTDSKLFSLWCFSALKHFLKTIAITIDVVMRAWPSILRNKKQAIEDARTVF